MQALAIFLKIYSKRWELSQGQVVNLQWWSMALFSLAVAVAVAIVNPMVALLLLALYFPAVAAVFVWEEPSFVQSY